MERHEQIEETAAHWLVRRDSDEWSQADADELERWLGASTAHRVAFLRLQAGWQQSGRLQALAAGVPDGTVPPPGSWRVSPLFERTMESTASRRTFTRGKVIVLAASLVLAVAIYAYYAVVPDGDAYSTPLGGIASIPLGDGSNITLNTASSVRVELSKEVRHIELERGEAFFDVAKDAARPFVVRAGQRRIVAVGTRFSVRRMNDEVRVVVTEGSVRLESEDEVVLAAGAIARASSAAILVDEQTVQEAETTLSWRSGFLTFDDTLLADAVAEFNRYTPRKIFVSDPGVAALRISGKFRATNAEAFVRVLGEVFGVRAEAQGERVILTDGSNSDRPALPR